MSKRKAKSSSKVEPEWKTKWPRNGDLKTWLRYMLKKCDAISNDGDAASRAHLPIEHLAKMGHEKEALRNVNRFLRRLPKDKVLETVRMAGLGAKISLDADDLSQMEKYLTKAEATEPFNTRKCDVGFSINSVRDFRADNGILNPADAVDDEQRIKASFERAMRQFKQAIKTRKLKAAKLAVKEADEIAHKTVCEWTRPHYLRLVIESYAELKDAGAVKRCIRKLDKEDRDEILDAHTLINLGMKSQAIARSKNDIARRLEELSKMTNPNIHFPVMFICNSLKFLVEHSEKNSAKHWLRRALKEMPTWPVIEYGWTTSAVYNSFAEVMAIIENPAAAEELLENAIADGKAEKRNDFRKGAINATLDLKANMGMLDEAIDDARKLRSPTQRRKKLGTLLARAKRWKELREVFSQVASPEEAAEIIWWIKFELPGGEVH